MFFFYQLIVSLLLLISPLIIIFRIFKKKEDKKRFKEKFVFPTKTRKKGKLIWFHGASVGEILSIIPLIKNYEKNKLISQILITSSTLSSSKVLKKIYFRKTIHQFYPIDHMVFTKKFLNYWKPNLALFVDSEIWPSMFYELKNKRIPLVLLNARLTLKTQNRWMKIKNFAKFIFDKITVIYPQNTETETFLKKIKLKNIKFIGNLKFTEDPNQNLNAINPKLKYEFTKKKVWVASSTHNNEEIFCARTHIELKKKIKNLITIIIPRHIHRVNEIVDEIEKLDLKVSCHSSSIKNLKDIDIYIVDTFGETKKFYNLASSVFLGGSIINRGGQNPLEAARFGVKIFHGPNTGNFKDVYKLLKAFKISKQINTPLQLASLIIFKKNKNSAFRIKNIGDKILKKTIKELDNLFNNEFKKT